MNETKIVPLRRTLPAAVIAFGLACAAQADVVPTPRATLVPVSGASRPFLGAAGALQPVDLATRGYVEEEYFVRGQARAYDWPVAPATVVQPRAQAVPYVTRVLLRRPLDGRKFSGRLVVEILAAEQGYETAPIWGLSQEHFLRSGDAYAALTVSTAGVAALKKFDPQRYAPLTVLNPAPAETQGCALPAAASGDPALAWDVIAQVGAMLRSQSKENPLSAYQLRHIYAAGYGEAAGYLATFIDALHAPLRLGDDAAVFDGYLQAGLTAAQPLAACATNAPPARAAARDAPLLRLQPQTDVATAVALRRDDSDADGEAFRGYELAGVAHAGPFRAGLPSRTDVTLAGGEVFDADESCADRPTDLFAGPLYNAAWAALHDWTGAGTLPPHFAPLALDARGQVSVDAHGNAAGGMRLPQLDVPAAAYAGSSSTTSADARLQKLCAASGSVRRFDQGEFAALYRTSAEFNRRVDEAVKQAVAEHRLLEADAAAVRSAATRASGSAPGAVRAAPAAQKKAP